MPQPGMADAAAPDPAYALTAGYRNRQPGSGPGTSDYSASGSTTMTTS